MLLQDEPSFTGTLFNRGTHLLYVKGQAMLFFLADPVYTDQLTHTKKFITTL